MQKSILITGASTGIGLACAKACAAWGYKVYAGVRKNKDAKNLEALSPNIESLILDVTQSEHINKAYNHINSQNGELDLLLNNAGVAMAGPCEFLPIEDFRWQLEVNVVGQLAITQKMLPLLRKSKDARIVFTSSISGFFAKPLIGAYVASKFALEGMADSLRMELAPWNIKVALLQPGSIKTPIWEKSLKESEELEKKMGPLAMKYYGDLIEVIKKSAKLNADEGVDVSEVVKAFEQAITSKKPKTRYLVGSDAKAQSRVKKILPDKLSDKIIAKALKKRAQSV